MTFRKWLYQQCNRDDPVGDLARDFCDDHNKPKGLLTLNKFESYLINVDACEDAIDTLHREWAEYECVIKHKIFNHLKWQLQEYVAA